MVGAGREDRHVSGKVGGSSSSQTERLTDDELDFIIKHQTCLPAGRSNAEWAMTAISSPPDDDEVEGRGKYR